MRYEHDTGSGTTAERTGEAALLDLLDAAQMAPYAASRIEGEYQAARAQGETAVALDIEDVGRLLSGAVAAFKLAGALMGLLETASAPASPQEALAPTPAPHTGTVSFVGGLHTAFPKEPSRLPRFDANGKPLIAPDGSLTP